MKKIHLLITLLLLCSVVFAAPYSVKGMVGICADPKLAINSLSYVFDVDVNYTKSDKIDFYVGVNETLSLNELDFRALRPFVKNSKGINTGVLYSLDEHYKLGGGLGIKYYEFNQTKYDFLFGLNLRFDALFKVSDKYTLGWSFNKFVTPSIEYFKINNLRTLLNDVSFRVAMEIGL